MTPPTKTWKSVETAISRYFPNGQRRGADYRKRDGPGGKNDVITTGWSVEIKHSKSPTWGLMVAAVAQAQASKESPDDIPVAVIHKERTEYGQSLVVMTLSDFSDHFLNQANQPD
jgi:hypothetical protein